MLYQEKISFFKIVTKLKKKRKSITTVQYLSFVTFPILRLSHLKKWPPPIYRPRTNHTGHKKSNPSRETVPLRPIFPAWLFN